MPKSVRTTIKDNSLVEERRELIVTRAIELFLREGYHATTTKALAEACGMSVAGLYQYVGSKRDILHLIAINNMRRSEALAEQMEAEVQKGVVSALRKYISNRTLAGDRTRDTNILINREIRNFSREDRRLLLGSVVDNVRTCEKLLAKGIESGVFRVRSPFLMAHEIAMVAYNWGQRRWLLSQYTTIEEYIGEWTENILDLILVDRENRHGVEGIKMK